MSPIGSIWRHSAVFPIQIWPAHDPQRDRPVHARTLGKQQRHRDPGHHRDPRWLPMPEFDFIRAAILVWLRVKQRTFGILMM